MKIRIGFVFAIMACIASAQAPKEIPVSTVVGYVRDSACAHRFHEVLKPLPNGCVQACVRAGSPLVVLTRDEKIFQPISAAMPDFDVRGKLLPLSASW